MTTPSQPPVPASNSPALNIAATETEIAEYRHLRGQHWRSAVSMGLLLWSALLPWIGVQLLYARSTSAQSVYSPTLELILSIALIYTVLATAFMFYNLGVGVRNYWSMIGSSLIVLAMCWGYFFWILYGTGLDRTAGIIGLILVLGSVQRMWATNHLRKQLQVHIERWKWDLNATPASAPLDQLEDLEVSANWDRAKPAARTPQLKNPADPHDPW